MPERPPDPDPDDEPMVHRNEAGLYVTSQAVTDEYLRNVGKCTVDLTATPDPDPDRAWMTVQTEWGPVRVPVKVWRLWNANGWPNDATLRWMVERPPADPDPQERP